MKFRYLKKRAASPGSHSDCVQTQVSCVENHANSHTLKKKRAASPVSHSDCVQTQISCGENHANSHTLKKRLISLFSAMIIFGSTLCASAYEIPQWITDYAAATYQSALREGNRSSFNGYCGTYVRCQLTAMGIYSGRKDFAGNGNTWYNGFDNITLTSGGYGVYRESGGDCLNKLIAKYGNNLRNIVVSFPVQAGYTPENPGAGHAFLIHAIIDGVAYYTESFGFGNHPEGSVIAEDVNEMVARYARRHYEPIGCVMFAAEALTPQAVTAEMPTIDEAERTVVAIEELPMPDEWELLLYTAEVIGVEII